MKKGGRRERLGIPYCSEYVIWIAMWNRCCDPKTKRFENYGGRGIRVCERWRDFFAFIEDMGRRPSLKHSLDRKEVDGSYEPGNCRWATAEEQQANKRNSLRIKFEGMEWSASSLARHFGVRLRTVQRRFDECGDWVKACELAKTNREDERKLKITIDGETRSLQGWCKLAGIEAKLVWQRITRDGWTPEEAITREAARSRRGIKMVSRAGRPVQHTAKTPKRTAITINGVTKSMSAWCRDMGIVRSTATRQFRKHGDWSKVFTIKT